MDRLTAALADRYRILREVGAGGMATVYLADDLRHGRQVALKVLRPELAATLGPDRFFREIHVAARLQHPHILPLHDSGEAEGLLYFVMPFVSGESLRERLDRTSELPVSDTVRILIQIADALAYSHAQGVVHRDIKPDNIMLTSRHAMLMDFGVAKAVYDAAEQSSVTTAGVALGTPTYMAPEQATADPQLDHRVDIYALGVVAYEMLTGRPPFSGLSPQQTLAAHVTRAPDPVSTYRDTCPPELEAVIMKCLAKRAADRYQSAEALLQALEPLSASSGGITPTQTRPATSGATERASATPEKSRIRTYAVAATLGVITLGGGWIVTQQDVTTDPILAGALPHTQVTSSGVAFAGALSPDGQRVAHAERVCDSVGRCTSDVRVQDVSGAGHTTLLRGLAGVGDLIWSDDGRWILMQASINGRYGTYSIPAIGGEARYLGCCSGTNTTGDTVAVTPPNERGAPTVVRLVTMADGIVRDSLLFTVSPANVQAAWLVPRSENVLLAVLRDQGVALILMNREGQQLDSMSLDRPALSTRGVTVSSDGFAVALAGADRGSATVQWFRFVGRDRIQREPVRVVDDVQATNGVHVSRDGTLTVSHGPIESALWTIERTSHTSLDFVQTLVGRSTSGIVGSISSDGSQVLIARSPPSNPEARELSVRSFVGGQETSIGVWDRLVDWDFHQDGKQLVAVTRDVQKQMVLEIDTRSGQGRPLGEVAADANWFETVQGGGYVYVKGVASVALRGVAARPDTIFDRIGGLTTVAVLEPSPDGRSVAVGGWTAAFDSTHILQLDLRTGASVALASFRSEGVGSLTWMSNGSVLVPIMESQHTEIWYQLDPIARTAVRLGLAPRTSANYRFARDGLRGVAREAVQRSDVYLLRGADASR